MADGGNWRASLNPASLEVLACRVEPALAAGDRAGGIDDRRRRRTDLHVERGDRIALVAFAVAVGKRWGEAIIASGLSAFALAQEKGLMNRLLTPHRLPTYRRTNVHEVLVRVKGVVQAEFPAIPIEADFDISLPEIARLKPAYLVISPGPCAPAQAGISLAAIGAAYLTSARPRARRRPARYSYKRRQSPRHAPDVVEQNQLSV